MSINSNDRDLPLDRTDAELRADEQLRADDQPRAGELRGEEARVVLSEEELAVGKRQVAAGEVTLEKRVETEHVREEVALRHDEVTVERHPIQGGMVAGGANTIGEENVRVSLTAEEAVVEKRVVPVEEVVVRKHAVTEEQTVEADLRSERAEVREIDAREVRDDRPSTSRDTL